MSPKKQRLRKRPKRAVTGRGGPKPGPVELHRQLLDNPALPDLAEVRRTPQAKASTIHVIKSPAEALQIVQGWLAE